MHSWLGTLKHVFPFFHSEKWPRSPTYSAHTGSHVGCMGKCIRIAKASSTYLSSVSSTVCIFLLLLDSLGNLRLSGPESS